MRVTIFFEFGLDFLLHPDIPILLQPDANEYLVVPWRVNGDSDPRGFVSR